MIVYGIPNCDTIKKTTDWLKKNKISYQFHDYKKSGIDKITLEKWCKKVGWEIVLNKKSSTWRSLPPNVQEKISNLEQAIKIMMENSSIIKRPVIENGNNLLIGYDEKEFIKHLK